MVDVHRRTTRGRLSAPDVRFDAWWDTIDTGAISSIVDEHPKLIVRLAQRGMFVRGHSDGEAFAEVTNESAYAILEVDGAPTDRSS